jgi:hypothetical protein
MRAKIIGDRVNVVLTNFLQFRIAGRVTFLRLLLASIDQKQNALQPTALAMP